MKAPLLSAFALAAGLGLLMTLALSATTPAGNAPGRALARATPAKDRQVDKKAGALTEHASTGWATVTGTMTYDGTPPQPKKINMAGNRDADACHDGATEKELIEQTWIVNAKNKGVANAVIWLRPPPGKFFKIHPSYLARDNNVVTLRQPHCAFLPHVVVYWASYYDKATGEQKPSGQKLRLLNDARINHNVAWSGNEDINPKGSVTFAPGKEKMLTLNADLDAPIAVMCQFHPWMSAKIWSLDTPYAARTDENGQYTLPRVPAGAPLQLVVWHESSGFAFGKGGKTLTFANDGAYIYNVKMKVGP